MDQKTQDEALNLARKVANLLTDAKRVSYYCVSHSDISTRYTLTFDITDATKISIELQSLAGGGCPPGTSTSGG